MPTNVTGLGHTGGMGSPGETTPSERSRRWASTMDGFPEPTPGSAGGPSTAEQAVAAGLRLAHADSRAVVGGAGSEQANPNGAEIGDWTGRAARGPKMRRWRPARPGRRRPVTGLAPRIPIRGGPASSGTGTASCMRQRSGAWPARRRSSSSPRTICGHASPTPWRWRRSPPAWHAPAGSTWPSPRRSRSATTAATDRAAMPARTRSTPTCRVASTTPPGVPRCRWPHSTSAERPSTGSPTTAGPVRHPTPPRARS